MHACMHACMQLVYATSCIGLMSYKHQRKISSKILKSSKGCQIVHGWRKPIVTLRRYYKLQ